MKKLLSILAVASTVCGCLRAGRVPGEILYRLESNDPTLTEVSLHNLDDSQEGIGCLKEALENNTQVKILRLSSDTLWSIERIGEKAACCVAGLMLTNKSIQEIILDGHRMWWPTLAELSWIFEINNPSLKIFRLRGNSMSTNVIGEPGFYKFLDNLKKNTTLEVLDLSNNGIGCADYSQDAIMNALREWLEKNTSLRELNLSRNSLGERGVGFLANALDFNKTLKVLNLSGNRNADVIDTLFSGMVDGSFEELNLSGNNINDEAIRYMKGFLRRCGKNLKRLDLSDNKIGNEGVKMLCTAIKAVPNQLEYLDLSSNPISEEGITALKALQDTNPGLEINLDNKASR